jgi:chemotaxis protein methyltransferase CheR
MSLEIKTSTYKYFADIVFKRTGIFYPEKDFYRLDSRLMKLNKHYECDTADELKIKCETSMTADMEMVLIDMCTNNETYFFRDQKPFDALTKEIIPELFNDRASLNVWSCASSTGQEPLSILMSLKEAGITKPVRLEASDISEQALNKCKGAIYTGLDVQRGLPIQLLMKYFDSVEDGAWRAKPVLTSLVTYKKFNLFKDIYKSNYYDIIFCRNVLIYQNQENKEEILQSLCSALRPGGVIIMGAGESLIGIKSNLEQKVLKNGIIFQKSLLNQSVA